MRFSRQEIQDLLIAWVLVSAAVTIALGQESQTLLTNFIISGVTVGLGFVVHELAHKFTAQHYGKFAEFRASLTMLVLGLVVAFSGLVIAAPGAVIISGFVSRKENGIISAAGPAVNIALALIFLPLFLFLPVSGAGAVLLSFGFLVNAWLALFNLIPFGIFDGAKIITWNKLVYASLVGASVILVFIGQLFVYRGF